MCLMVAECLWVGRGATMNLHQSPYPVWMLAPHDAPVRPASGAAETDRTEFRSSSARGPHDFRCSPQFRASPAFTVDRASFPQAADASPCNRYGQLAIAPRKPPWLIARRVESSSS